MAENDSEVFRTMFVAGLAISGLLFLLCLPFFFIANSSFWISGACVASVIAFMYVKKASKKQKK